MTQLEEIKKELQKASNPETAEGLRRYFKTGKGQYGEGDVFIGIKMPVIRSIAKKYDLSQSDIEKLLQSPIHEERMTALMILVRRARKASEEELAAMSRFYLKNKKYINNWDLIDLSAEHIVGEHLYRNDRKILDRLASSSSVWDRRIAMLCCFAFIKKGEYDFAIHIANTLIKDKHDLIHKASGWMLREIGNRDQKTLEKYLAGSYKKMPRTMLRYSIEKFPEKKRQAYLKGRI